MASEFSKSVELGLKLSERIYYGKEYNTTASVPPSKAEMTIETGNYLPQAVMVYAEISEPSIVDNPDIPSYQPYVHGRIAPPALIPLHMYGVSAEVDCYLDTAFVTVSGTWRVHCVAASRTCPCRIAVPIGQQGSLLGVEIENSSKSNYTQLTAVDAAEDADKVVNSKDGILIKGQIYTLKIPKVEGGTIISLKVSWSQKLTYQNGKFCLNVPFIFPLNCISVVKNLPKKEKIMVNVNSCAGIEVLYQSESHPVKTIREDSGKIGFLYEREVSNWSTNDFRFSYNVSAGDIFGGLLLQSPGLHDYDQREAFCLYMYPGKTRSEKVFRKDAVFLVDISASMLGSPLENVKTAVIAALLKLNPVDTFNIITFNESSSFFSPSSSLATKDMIDKASEWIEKNFVASGGTNISAPLYKAIDMVSNTGDLLPIIFLITDGAVEDEKGICDAMKTRLMKGGLTSPRICTFGIGLYCNHYFLRMLAQIGRGTYEAAFDVDSISLQLKKSINCASSVILADITIGALKHLDSLEIYPFHIPDLSSGYPLVISGRYHGKFPESVEVSGTLAELGKFVMNIQVHKAKFIPVDQICARRQIDALTAQAWVSGSKQLEEKVTKLSLQTGVPSEYTNIILIETDKIKLPSKLMKTEKTPVLKDPKITVLQSLGIGFGNIKATLENRPPELAEPKLYETSDKIFKAATNFCGRMIDCCCCMCFIRTCSRVNDQCAVILTQLCAALACFECINVCCEVCACE